MEDSRSGQMNKQVTQGFGQGGDFGIGSVNAGGDAKNNGGVSVGGKRNVRNNVKQQNNNKKQGKQRVQENVGQKIQQQKIVSLKGVQTQSELEAEKNVKKIKEGAIVLDKQKTGVDVKKEKELEKLKKEAIVIQNQKINNNKTQEDKKSFGQIENKNKQKQRNKSDIIVPKPATVITPEGGIQTEVDKLGNKHIVKLDDLENANGAKSSVNLMKQRKNNSSETISKDRKNVVDLGIAKNKENIKQEINQGEKQQRVYQGQTQENESKDNWRNEKIDLSVLSSEGRIRLQATPSLASVNRKMDNDLNEEMVQWFKEYDKLPVNIKVGLSDEQIRQLIIKLAQDFEVYNEEGLGEISRIVRDVYVSLIEESEIRRRATDNLKIIEGQVDVFVNRIAEIVAMVREIGTKKSDEYYDKLPIKEILEKYPKIIEEEITSGVVVIDDRMLRPTIKNWLNDYINFAGSQAHSSLDRGRYLSNSKNIKNLDEDEKKIIDTLLRSYDNDLKLVVDIKEEAIYWRLHVDESRLGINSDNNKRVINNFKIEEAQEVDVDDFINRGERSDRQGNNLDKNIKHSIIDDNRVEGETINRGVLNLSSELENKNVD